MAAKHLQVQEDCVEYQLFPPPPEGLEPPDEQEYLEERCDQYLGHLGSLLVSYIWQKEPFNLNVHKSSGLIPGHLRGITRFGDNIEDEWFIVYMLYELTKTYPGLVARVWDTDGEFLLIEAADHIPKWLEPATSENRIFISEGQLHIIPKAQRPGAITTTGTPDLEDSLVCIRDYPTITLAHNPVQSAIKRRIKEYPGKIEANMHHAHCYIPAALAAVLEDNPQLLAAGVEAFYYRDPVDLKACRTFTHFRPGTRVMREVKFTRCLYAQLMQQRFQPDPRSGWTLPATSNPKHKSHEIGMKLAHGFEILCAKCSAKPGQTNPSTIADNDVRWQRYKSTLQEKGYFKGEVEGSQLYRQLEQSAKKHFSEAVATQESNSKDAGHQVLTLLDSLKYDIEDLRKQEKNLKKPDNDSWLDITPQQLDDLIHKTTGQNTTDDTFDLTDIANSMKSFVNNVSGFEGAEFPGQEEGDIQFNSSSFMQDMQKLVDLDDNMGDSSSDDMSEYGSDDELDELGPSPRKPPPKQNGQSMKGYMDAMDRELAQTNVGKSFERESKPVAPPRHKKAKVPARARPESDEFDIDDLDDDFEPVNVDLTVVKNMMESYKSQQGLPGPGGNILGSMGVRIPEDSGSSDQDSTPAATPTSERESPKKETTV